MNHPDCRYFHYDAFRGREIMRCRLLEQSGNHDEWSLRLCDSCPVPRLVQETTCRDLMLEGEVKRRFGLFPRVEVFAVCGNAMQPLHDPRNCPYCTGTQGKEREN
jgi:hypothetical protein